MYSRKITFITILVLVSLALIAQDQAVPASTKYTVTNQGGGATSDEITEKSMVENFSAEIIDEKVFINWNVNNVDDISGFELYKSNDGSGWELIAYLESNEGVDYAYEFVDETPNFGDNYYRLRMLDLDGAYTFLRTTKVVLKYSTGADIGNFFPNPVTNGTTSLNINIPDGGEATIYLHDSMGRLAGIYQKTIASGKDIISLDLTDLTYGIYYIKISINREVYVRTVMIRMSDK